MRPRHLTTVALCALAFAALGGCRVSAESGPEAEASKADTAASETAPVAARSEPAAAESGADYVGSAACRGCHADLAKRFDAGPHAKSEGWKETRGCESCHGPGSEHLKLGGQGGIAKLDELPPKESSQACLGCHATEDLAPGIHANATTVGCVTCHVIHPQTDEAGQKKRKTGSLATPDRGPADRRAALARRLLEPRPGAL